MSADETRQSDEQGTLMRLAVAYYTPLGWALADGDDVDPPDDLAECLRSMEPVAAEVERIVAERLADQREQIAAVIEVRAAGVIHGYQELAALRAERDVALAQAERDRLRAGMEVIPPETPRGCQHLALPVADEDVAPLGTLARCACGRWFRHVDTFTGDWSPLSGWRPVRWFDFLSRRRISRDAVRGGSDV